MFPVGLCWRRRISKSDRTAKSSDYEPIVTENPSQLRRAGLGNGIVRALSIELLSAAKRSPTDFLEVFWRR